MNEHFDDLKFHRLLSSEDALFGQFSELFQSSFPVNERRPLESLKKIISDESDVYCDAVLRNNVYVGLLVYWDFADFVYVEYLAVDPDIRGGGIGARILSQLRDGVRKPVVLEVEPPFNELAKRRIGFYERNGFEYSHTVKDFFSSNYDHPIYENGKMLRDMVYLKCRL